MPFTVTSQQMSASRRRKVSDPKRARPAERATEPEEELPTLEPLESDDELETLEPILDDDSPVRVTVVPADEPDFDTCVEIHVPDMPKPEVAAAVDAPLRVAAARAGAELRWKRVLARFGGEAIIGTAVKELVTEVLGPVRPLTLVVRRGFGDERVVENELPTVTATVTPEPDSRRARVRVDSGALESADLASVMRPALAAIAPQVSARLVAVEFAGARPDAAARATLAEVFGDATRVALRDGEQEDVIFDRELEARVRVADSGPQTDLTITPGDEDSVVEEALTLVLRQCPERISDKRVHVRFEGREPRPRELVAVVEACAALAPQRIELVSGTGEPDVLWPRLVQVVEDGDEVVLQVRGGGRSPAGIAGAFVREVEALDHAIAGRKVSVDWPADFEVGSDTEDVCIGRALAAHRPARIACTFGGEDREPFRPEPLAFREEAGVRVIRLDTDTGRPIELVRAIERRVPRHAGELKGSHVRVDVAGSGAVSRTMVRSLRDAILRAGASRLEIDDHGTRDVLLPPLLQIEADGARTFRILADPAGRDAAQVQAAMQRELDAFELPAGATVRVAASPLAGELVETLVRSRGAARVLLDGEPPVQVHPLLFEAPDRTPGSLTLRANPGDDEATVLAQVDHELPPVLEAQPDLGGVDVLVVWPGGTEPRSPALERTLDVILGTGPKKLSLDTGDGRQQQLFPEVVPDWAIVIGKKDDATPPLVMIGIDRGEGEAHTANVMAKLEQLAPDFDGRRVLLTLRDGDRELPITDTDALAATLRAWLEPKVPAILLHRGRDRASRTPFFEVVHSTLEALPVGTKVRDPRPGR